MAGSTAELMGAKKHKIICRIDRKNMSVLSDTTKNCYYLYDEEAENGQTFGTMAPQYLCG